MQNFLENRERFGAFYQAVKQAHLEAPLPHRGHGLDHDVTVATFAATIAPDLRTAELAWIAALIHSTDRMIGREDRAQVEMRMRELLTHLPLHLFTRDEIDTTVEAALRHMEKNQPDQSLVQVVLMDADRLANLMPSVVIRSGQFNAEIPALELTHLREMNPASTYRRPASVVDDLRKCIEWKTWLRTDKGKELGYPLVAWLEDYIETIAQGYDALGLTGIDL